MEAIRINCRKQTKEELELGAYYAGLVHKFNQALPYTEEWMNLMHKIFKGKIGEDSRVSNKVSR